MRITISKESIDKIAALRRCDAIEINTDENIFFILENQEGVNYITGCSDIPLVVKV